MPLDLILPQVKPNEIDEPSQCANKGCKGRRFRLDQTVKKSVRDTMVEAVTAKRYQCLACGRTFRVYPQGVSANHTSQRVKGLAVMLYLLGLSYGATSLALGALGVYRCKSGVYEAVQAAGKRRAIFEGRQTPALGADLTTVRCQGRALPLALTVDAIDGWVLSVDAVPAEDAQTLKTWPAPIAEQVGAEILVTDDADSFKRAAKALDLAQQVCKSHVVRHTEALLAPWRSRMQMAPWLT